MSCVTVATMIRSISLASTPAISIAFRAAAVATNLPAGESITLDTSANGNVTLSNSGSG